MNETEDQPLTWKVLINDEEQYALHPEELDAPAGWRPVGFAGTEKECMRHVDARWTDTRPLSLRSEEAG